MAGNSGLAPLVRKIRRFGELGVAEQDALGDLLMATRVVSRGKDIVREGQNPSAIAILMRGLACRYRMLPQGGRQVTAVCVPGDILNLQSLYFDELDHSIGALGECMVGLASHERIGRLLRCSESVRAALAKDSIIQAATAREWIVNVGRRSSHEAVAHLICEIVTRLSLVEPEGGREFSVGLTQVNIADCIGISPVHVNRVLRKMVSAGMISFNRGHLRVNDWEGLRKAAAFNPAYLRSGCETRAAYPALVNSTGTAGREAPPGR